jgi:hypothetical protein
MRGVIVKLSDGDVSEIDLCSGLRPKRSPIRSPLADATPRELNDQKEFEDERRTVTWGRRFVLLHVG